MNAADAIQTVQDFVLAAHGLTPDATPEIMERTEAAVYTYGVHEQENRSPECGLRVAEVSLWTSSGPGTGAGGSWMQVDMPHGIAVCGQAERCIVALIENWDSGVPGEIKAEFWRFGFAMFQDAWVANDDFSNNVMELAPGEWAKDE